MSVEPLTGDFLRTEPERNSGLFGATGVEAPVLFRRNDTYIALFGHTCCFCRAGAAVTQYLAPSPLGPFSQRGAVDSVGAQQTAVFEFASTDAAGGGFS